MLHLALLRVAKSLFGGITCDMRILQATMEPTVERTGPTVIEPSAVRWILCRALRRLRVLSTGASREMRPFAFAPQATSAANSQSHRLRHRHRWEEKQQGRG